MEIKHITLTQGKFAMVNATDYEWLMQWKWCALKVNNTFYAMRNSRVSEGVRHKIFMHAVIAGVERPDHIDHNGLNNTRDNLRAATRAENMHNKSRQRNNTSGFIGVYWDSRFGKWKAHIWINGKSVTIGRWNCSVCAAKARDSKALEVWGDYANLNFKKKVVGRKFDYKEVS